MIRGPARPAVQNTASSYCRKFVYACFIDQPLLFCRFSLPQRSASCLAAGSRTVQTAAAARPGIPPASPGGIGQKLNHCDGGFSLFRIVKLLPDQGSGRASCLPRFPAAARLLFNLHRMRPVGSSLLGDAPAQDRYKNPKRISGACGLTLPGRLPPFSFYTKGCRFFSASPSA